MLKKLWDKITGKEAVRKMICDFEKAFPGRCIICAYHNYGLSNGLTQKPVAKHNCIEKKQAL